MSAEGMDRAGWTLLVATYNRPEMLISCIQAVLRQTRLPSQIVVIDASTDWEVSRESFFGAMAAAPLIDLEYQPALERSLASQRNQGLPLCKAEVIFLLDDDSLMYPTCAEEILKVYEADLHAVVAGVQSNLSAAPPSGVVVTDEPKQTGRTVTPSTGWVGRVQKWVLLHVLLSRSEVKFIPYDGDFPTWELPPAVAELDVVAVPLMHGCRMTYRRDAVQAEGFEGLLRGWSAGEDLDASYRISRRGALLTARRAKLCHFESATARLDQRKTTILSTANQALFLRRHGTSRDVVRRKHLIMTGRRLLAGVIKDVANRRWGMPVAQGVLVAAFLSRTLFRISDEELGSWYTQVQEVVLSGEIPRLRAPRVRA